MRIDTDLLDYGFPSVNPEVFSTEGGQLFLESPGVALVLVPQVNLSGLKGFLDGFPKELGFFNYLNDPVKLTPAETICKTAGQLCYLSFGPNRSMNINAGEYFRNIKKSGHGSVMEHANFTMLWWGISRSLTHELVRHRAGFGFSQVSQRFVGGKTLRFIERPEFQNDKHLHNLFLRRVDRSYKEYEDLTDYLLEKQRGTGEKISAEMKTDLRKKVRQASRALLPNETEGAVMVTANVRAWRHFFNVRVSEHAEVEIRRVGFEAFRCLFPLAPMLFGDFETVHLPDGTHSLKTEFPKV